MIRRSSLLCALLLCACGVETSPPGGGPRPCSEPWLQMVEETLSTGDGQGHGPDLGSSEWRSVVEFKLGIRGKPGVPDSTTEEWCTYIDQAIAQAAQ